MLYRKFNLVDQYTAFQTHKSRLSPAVVCAVAGGIELNQSGYRQALAGRSSYKYVGNRK